VIWRGTMKVVAVPPASRRKASATNSIFAVNLNPVRKTHPVVVLCTFIAANSVPKNLPHSPSAPQT
jgi:hypothetical protein